MTTNLATGFDTDGSGRSKEAAARTAGIVSLVVLAVGLGGFALGIEWAWVVFPVGYGGVLPVAVSRARTRASSDGHTDERRGDDPLETLRERYASGEIDDVEFERRVEALLETEQEDRG